MSSKSRQSQRSNRRKNTNFRPKSGPRFFRDPSRVNASVIRRTIIASADATMTSGNSKQILQITWSSSIASAPDWSLISALYQQFRLVEVKYRFCMPPGSSTGSVFDVVMVSDIYSNYSTSLNPLQYMQMRGAKPFSSMMRSKSGYTSYTYTAPRGKGINMIDNASVAGQWIETTAYGSLLGRFLVVMNHSAGTTLSDDFNVVSGSVQFVLEFRNPFPSGTFEKSVALTPTVESERKSEILPRQVRKLVAPREEEFVEVKEPPPVRRASTPKK